MIRLRTDEYVTVEHLLKSAEHCVPAHAVVKGFNPGRVYVNEKENPRVALVWTKWGYYYLLGNPGDLSSPEDLADLIATELAPLSASAGETSPILYPSSAQWQGKVGTILRGYDAIRVFRQVFSFDPIEFSDRSSRLTRLYPRYVLRQIDEEIVNRHGESMAQDILASWESVDSFLRHGLGFCVFDGNQIVSRCISVAFDGLRLEMSVFTHRDYRRRGLATAVCETFVQRCIERDLTPSWECFWGNSASSSLAMRLAFRNVSDVPVYQWRLTDR